MPRFESHKLDKLLGPSGSFGGYVLLLTGVVAVFYSLSAIILIMLGAFAAFTATETVIDGENRRVRYSTALFGIIMTGRWINVTPEMNIRVRQSGRSYTSYSRSNRSLTVSERDFTIVLKRPDGTEICPLQRFRTREEAESRLPHLASHLGCGIIT